ncbi:MAG: ribosome recycling factor [Candidatus Cloacimonetes bacterium]|nr:ribosome recycling factor [Candidatus Cloacimonadota bacterium]
MKEYLIEIDKKMEKSFEAMLGNFSKIRTGRANASILDNIKINYYGALTPVKQLCNISIPEARMIVLQPWDKTTLAEIEKAIYAANLGVTPENDGNIIRLPFQALTEDKRKDIVKQLKQIGEEAKIAVRNIRRDANEYLKKAKKDSLVTEDEEKKHLKDIQDKTDKWISKIDESLSHKEKEIMEV